MEREVAACVPAEARLQQVEALEVGALLAAVKAEANTQKRWALVRCDEEMVLVAAAMAKGELHAAARALGLKAVLEADPVRTHADREQLMRTLGLAEGAAQVQPDRIIPIEEAAARLNRTKRSLHHLARRGVLKKFKIPGMSRACGIRESDLNSLLAGAA